MKLNMTHNESSQTLKDLSRHLELEAEHRLAQGHSSAFFAKHGQRQAFKAKRKNYEKAPQQGQSEWRKTPKESQYHQTLKGQVRWTETS
jgi:surface antigen